MNSQDPRTKYPKPGSEEKTQSYPGIEESMNTQPDYGEESYRGSGRLEGKVTVVTGGDSGIGRAVAVAFAKEGADVVVAYLEEETEDAEKTLDVIREVGRKGVGFTGDFSDLSNCEKLVQKTVDEFGRIDVLVNNAALQKNFESLGDITPEDFEEIYRINVVAPFVLIQKAAKHMQPGGSVINTVSVQAYDPSFILLPYAASKGAFTELTKGLADQLIEKGIRVNAVAPGPIWSPLNTHAAPERMLREFGEGTTIGRPGQPVELAPLYVLLASNEASYITGEVYGITGGSGIV